MDVQKNNSIQWVPFLVDTSVVVISFRSTGIERRSLEDPLETVRRRREGFFALGCGVKSARFSWEKQGRRIVGRKDRPPSPSSLASFEIIMQGPPPPPPPPPSFQ